MLSSIEVCCVVGDHSHVDTDIELVNEYVSNLGLKFKLREYNTWKYSDDRDMISSLPAFHIYFGEGYIDTIYPDGKVLDNIDEYVTQYEKNRSARLRLIEVWKNILYFWKSKRT
jgi:hypothetical protein